MNCGYLVEDIAWRISKKWMILGAEYSVDDIEWVYGM
jgi:hypothetical protein